MLSWLVTAALYPLSTLKVRSQLMPTRFSIGIDATSSLRSGLYRGVLPFLFINAVFGFTLRPLLSEGKLEALKETVLHEKIHTLNKAWF